MKCKSCGHVINGGEHRVNGGQFCRISKAEEKAEARRICPTHRHRTAWAASECLRPKRAASSLRSLFRFDV